MPTTSLIQQKHFKLTIENEVLQAPIELIRGEQWLTCCPLCGCMHQLQGVDASAPYSPMCQTVPILFKAQQVIWQKLYPDAAPYKTVQLVQAAV